MMRFICAVLASLLFGAGVAEAGTSTLAVSPGTGATFGVITDGSSNLHPYGAVCDYSACANGWSIDSNHGGLVAGEGTAGTPAGGVVSIQGVSSGTTVPVTLQASATTAIGKVDPNTIATWGLAAIGGTTGSPTNALVAGCQYNSSAPTFTSGDSGAVQCTVAGSIHATIDNTNANGQTTMVSSSPVVIASNQSAVAVTVNGQGAAARNFPGCSVGTSSAQCLASSTAVQFLQVENTAASASVACRFGAAAVLNSSTSFQAAAGQGASWGPNTGGVPSGALNCIASGASTPLYLEWN